MIISIRHWNMSIQSEECFSHFFNHRRCWPIVLFILVNRRPIYRLYQIITSLKLSYSQFICLHILRLLMILHPNKKSMDSFVPWNHSCAIVEHFPRAGDINASSPQNRVIGPLHKEPAKLGPIAIDRFGHLVLLCSTTGHINCGY